MGDNSATSKSIESDNMSGKDSEHTSNKSEEDIDIFDHVKLYGIEDLVTHHSFKVTYCVWPRKCVICQNLVYLNWIDDIIICMRCKLVIHRECMRNVACCPARVSWCFIGSNYIQLEFAMIVTSVTRIGNLLFQSDVTGKLLGYLSEYMDLGFPSDSYKKLYECNIFFVKNNSCDWWIFTLWRWKIEVELNDIGKVFSNNIPKISSWLTCPLLVWL